MNLCDACVEQSRQAAGRRLTIITGSLLGIGVLAVLGAFVAPGRLAEVMPAIGLAFGIFALLAYVRLRAVNTVPREAGQRKALDLHVDELKGQGYNAFWSSSAEL